MSNFSSLVITNAGKELVAKLQANKERVTFTSVKTSNQKFEVDKLTAVDNFVGTQSRGIENLEYTDPNRVKVITNFNNIDVVAGYNVNSIGIFAKLDKTTEILYAVATVKEGVGDWMSANGSQNQVSMRFSALLTVSDLEVESVAIIEAGYVLEADFIAHTSATAIDEVHGADTKSSANSIMARDEHGMTKVKYNEQQSTSESVINRNKLTNEIEGIKSDYGKKLTDLSTEVGQQIANMRLTAITQERGISKWDPYVTYNIGDIVIVESYDGLGGGLNLIGWEELREVNFQINEIADIKKWGGDWASLPMYFIVKTNKGEYNWTVQDTIDNLKAFDETYTKQLDTMSVYEAITWLLAMQNVLTALDITGEFGKIEFKMEKDYRSIYRQGVNIV